MRLSNPVRARGALLAILLLGLASWPLARSPASPATVSGLVFLDANANGAADPGERAIAGCVVSDERSLARTGEDGRYELAPAPGAEALFVVNAPGTVATSRWWIRLPGASDAARIDFALRPEDQDGPLHFVHGTDLHVRPGVEPMMLRYVEHVNALPVPVSFVVHTGDLVIDSAQAPMERARELFDLYAGLVRPLRAPLRHAMGNHDVAGVLNPKLTGAEPGFGKALYRHRFGPTTYAFRHGRYHFVALDANTVKDRTIAYGLTGESADWAIAYLARVPADEPIVLLVHEPLFPEIAGVPQPDTPETRPHEPRLAAALAGKRLLLTLAGHAHTRTETTWGGAPHILGGAVSYAWHGIMPYPPPPRAYVVYRLEGDRVERVFLDWAEERSIDITTPAFSDVARGALRVSGVVADFGGGIDTVECALGDGRVTATVKRRGALASRFEATLDTTRVPDGAHDLVVTATGGGREHREVHPTVVVNGAPAPFAATCGARLRYRVAGASPGDLRLSFNGRSPEICAAPGAEVDVELPASALRRLNEIAIDPGAPAPGSKPPTVHGMTLEYGGKTFRDVRVAPGERRRLTRETVWWIDLTREGA